MSLVDIGIGVDDAGADGAAGDADIGVLEHHALLGAAVDVTHDGAGAADVDVGLARAAHGDPVWRLGGDVALAGADDVAGAGMGELAVGDDGPSAVMVEVILRVLVLGTNGGVTGDGNLGGAGAGCETGGQRSVEVGVVPPAHASHLAAAEDGAVDAGCLADVDGVVHDAACADIVVALDIALAGAEDVAAAVVGRQ